MKSAIRSLLEQAASLPDSTTEIVGADDVRYRITRAKDSASLRLDATDGPSERTIVWSRSRHRSDLYPQHLPFIPGVDVVVVLAGAGCSCTWSADGREHHADQPPGPSLDAMLALRPSAQTTDTLQAIWASAIEQSSSAGWTVVDEAGSDYPFPIRTTVFERDGRRRKIDRGGVMGLPVVTLNEVEKR